MKLVAESHKFLQLEHQDAYQRTIKQIEYMEKQKQPGASGLKNTNAKPDFLS